MQALAALGGGGTALSTCTCSVRELVRGPRWASDEQVAAVDRRGAELDDDLARADDGVVDLLEAEGAALADDHCLHGSDRMALSAPGASGGGGAGLRPAGADAGQGREGLSGAGVEPTQPWVTRSLDRRNCDTLP